MHCAMALLDKYEHVEWPWTVQMSGLIFANGHKTVPHSWSDGGKGPVYPRQSLHVQLLSCAEVSVEHSCLARLLVIIWQSSAMYCSPEGPGQTRTRGPGLLSRRQSHPVYGWLIVKCRVTDHLWVLLLSWRLFMVQWLGHWTVAQAVVGLTPDWGVIKSPRSTQPSIPPG